MSCRLCGFGYFPRCTAEQFGKIAHLLANIGRENKPFQRPAAVCLLGNLGGTLVEFRQSVGQFDHRRDRRDAGGFLLGLHGGCVQPVDRAAETVAVLTPKVCSQAGIQRIVPLVATV